MVKKKTTESSRRFAFASFRERVDSIKIDLNSSLQKRVFDFADISYFLTCLEHWKEVNLSGNFTSFLDEIEPISNSLPQILHHQSQIYESLYSYIEKNDILSLQPLLELLSQFIHDLGEDFLPYLDRTLNLLIKISLKVDPNDIQSQKNTSNALEWIFSCLAFTFKYLSRHIVQDLVPIIKSLAPVFMENKKPYVARFCAEGSSYLIRKAKADSIERLITYNLELLGSSLDNNTYYDFLVALYSEAMKGTGGTLHSKAYSILDTLIQKVGLMKNCGYKYSSMICDILLIIIEHTSQEGSKKLYDFLSQKICEIVALNTDLESLVFGLMSTCSIIFASSGKKISNWNSIFKIIEQLVLFNWKIVPDSDVGVCKGFGSYLGFLVFRNCEMNSLAANYSKLYEFLQVHTDSFSLYAFTEAGLDTFSDKLSTFKWNNQLKVHLNKTDPSNSEIASLALLVEKVRNVDSSFALNLPTSFLQGILDSLNLSYCRVTTETDIMAVCSRLILLNNASYKKNLEKDYLCSLVSSEYKFPSYKLMGNFWALIIDSFNSLGSEMQENDITLVFNLIINQLLVFIDSSEFIRSAGNFLLKNKATNNFHPEKELKSILPVLAKNLSLPNQCLRQSTITLLQIITEKDESNLMKSLLQECNLIESMPLTLENARDIQWRIRNMVNEYKNATDSSSITDLLLVRYLFGLLSNRFQPCWDAVIKCIPEIPKRCSNLVWDIAYQILTTDSKSASPEVQLDTITDSFEWNIKMSKLNESFRSYQHTYLSKYRDYAKSSLEMMKKGNQFLQNDLIKQHVISLLQAIPEVAERNSDLVAKLLLESASSEYETMDLPEASNMHLSFKERNGLIELFGKFKSIEKISKSEEIFEFLLHMLSSKSRAAQKMSLEVILNWKSKKLAPYKDNLMNLIEDSTFTEECAKLFLQSSESFFDTDALNKMMPLVVRIFFGRYQTPSSSNSKTSKKSSVLFTMLNFQEEYIVDFIKLGSERIGYRSFFIEEKFTEIKEREHTRVSGFLNMASELISVLGSQYQNSLKALIEPLLYCLAFSSDTSSSGIASQDEDIVLKKLMKNNRQLGMKCLANLFTLLGENYSWERYSEVLFKYIIKPRLVNFSDENLQSASSLLRIIGTWISFKNLRYLLYTDNFSAVRAIVSLFNKETIKEPVILFILEFSLKVLEVTEDADDQYFTTMALVANSILKNLPRILNSSLDSKLNSTALSCLMVLVRGDFVTDDADRGLLLDAISVSLEKPNSQITVQDRELALSSVVPLITQYSCKFKDIESLYLTCSKLLKFHPEKFIRLALVNFFNGFGLKFERFAMVANVIDGLNSYTKSKQGDINFEKRITTFRSINEDLYMNLTALEWIPIIYCALFYIADEEELSLRVSSKYTLKRFVDCLTTQSSETRVEFEHIFKNIVLPNLRVGLRNKNEEVQMEFISLLEHIVKNSDHIHDFKDLNILLFNRDDEANFFLNICHIQVHRRQRALRRMSEVCEQLSGNSIAFYIMPIVEKYALVEDEKLRNVSNEAIECTGSLLKYVSWSQYKTFLKRFISYLKNTEGRTLSQRVQLVKAACIALVTVNSSAEKSSKYPTILPKDEQETFRFVKEMAIPLHSFLGKRDDETIVSRIPLAECLVSLASCLPSMMLEEELPAILIKVCQVMRSRSEELRDATRKTLSNICLQLGPKYFKFVLKELKSSLSRGSQIHVLSFTIHSLLVVISPSLENSDLDESSNILCDIIMEDIFGAAGQEKDSEGYTSKMKEVKFKKSFDSGEIVASNISLSNFGCIIEPIKSLLREKISLKTKNKLEELMRRYLLGLNHNIDSDADKLFILAYEVHQMSFESQLKKAVNQVDQKESHFLVNLNSRIENNHVESSTYISSMQKFSLDLLKLAISKNKNKNSNIVPKLQEFIPILNDALESQSESVAISCLRVLHSIVKFDFSEDDDRIFKSCARKALNIIKNSPTTSTDICQASLKYLSSLLVHRDNIQLKDTAVSYVLEKIQPDLEEPKRQGLAFRFLKSVIQNHIMLPEVYDIMDKVSQIMIVNHSKEIRDMSRAIFYQFLMEYDQGRGRLEKSFKFLLDNLSYATQSGRQSVLELLFQIINKSGQDLISRLGISLFIVLTKVSVGDDSAKCREMSNLLLSTLLSSLPEKDISTIKAYCSSWLDDSENILLRRCGLTIYKLYCQEVVFDESDHLHQVAFKVILDIMDSAKNSEESSSDASWEVLFLSLGAFSAMSNCLKHRIFEQKYEKHWKALIEVLLYPHSWIRLISCRLMSLLVSNLDSLHFTFTEYEVQTIAYRLLRQIGAPSLSDELGTQCIKNLVLIATNWESKDQKYIQIDEANDSKSIKYDYATEFLISRVCSIIKRDNGDEYISSKKYASQLLGFLVQLLPVEKLNSTSESIVLTLVNLSDLLNNEPNEELLNITNDCLTSVEQKVGVSEYASLYAKVKQFITTRRQERRAKRAQMAVQAPDIAAKRKLRKHERSREKRKHSKDENGFYRTKKQKFQK